MASSWKPLPAHLSSPARLLTERLREVKDTRQLSLADIAGRTHYSKASWQRWLNGERLVTAQALESLLTQVGGDADALRGLLAQAAVAASTGASDDDAPDGPGARPDASPAVADAVPLPTDPLAVGSPAGPAPVGPLPVGAAPVGPGRRSPLREPRFLLSLANLAALVALIVVGVALLAAPAAHSARPRTTPTPTATATAAAAAAGTPDCVGVGCTGRDPQLTGCGADAVTLLTGNVGKVILYIRYSPSCRAAWAKLTDAAPRDTATITTNAGQSAVALVHWGYDAYSPMVDADSGTVTLRVCGQQPQGKGCTLPVSDPAARHWPSPGTPDPRSASAAVR
ncbi:DUF2690 domain-containing protein [Streptacidiphilus cavernicola]|uniref:DUF2690 domain-containing protein n=1 Tax=Streptacidiphilus cavernicola TaxID=3342716 RepID=A0ABV6VPG1_9ACTN